MRPPRQFVAPRRSNSTKTGFVHDLPKGGVSPGLDDVAYLNQDGSKVLVACNSAGAPATFAVRWQDRFLNWTLAPAATVTLVWR